MSFGIHTQSQRVYSYISNTMELSLTSMKVLMRHATQCKVPLPSAGESNEYTCSVTTHCAEGKMLANHIRKCKEMHCKYKWCLTTRNVLGHYRSCRDRKCQICGPVRALHRQEQKQQTSLSCQMLHTKNA